MILREVNTRPSFTEKRVSVMLAWNAVADAASLNDIFARPGFDGKRALNTFTLLMTGHHMNNYASARASGIDEERKENTELHDELVAAYEDWNSPEKHDVSKPRKKLIGLTTWAPPCVTRHCSHWVSHETLVAILQSKKYIPFRKKMNYCS
ncbi:hypothetical protein DYB28_000448 [Aphanomyces astaci]|uniref:Uncharacterized protein n=2 Tax=Aphanomyces astaci TaxID=112090 RepID=A0A3L6V8P2_APHAT|nr:hypothetical protein DYB35_012314 [Aphanomyces astaci]RLO05099.1 hypothetical protein DYB28_000448 [Aphanomyces astaci]